MRKLPFVLAPGFLFCLSLAALSQQSSGEGNAGAATVERYLHRAKDSEAIQPDSAAYFYQRATTLAFELKSKALLRTSMALHIKFLNSEGKFEEALSIAQGHSTMATRLKDPSLLLAADNEMANEYEYLGDYQPATEYYIRALELAGATGDQRMRRKLNNNLASVFLGLKDYATAYTYSAKALQMASQEKDTVTMGNCLINLGLSELHQQKFHEALDHFEEAEKIGYRIPDMTLVADALSDRGLVYYTRHNLVAATEAYREQKNIADKYHLDYEKLYALFQLALIEKEKGNYHNADSYASRAIAIGENLGTADELMEMYDSMAVIKQKTGDLKAALDYKNKYEGIRDSVVNEQIQTNIHHLNIQYRSAQKDKQIAEQNLAIERNRAALERENTWIFISVAALLALGTILALLIRSHRHKQKLHQQSLLTLQKEHEVDTLKAKMQAREEERDRIGREMHDDIGSALTTILYLSADVKHRDRLTAAEAADKIAGTAGSVVDKMNEIIWSMNREYDTLDDLIAYTRQHSSEFLENHNLRYQLDIPESLPLIHLRGEQRRNIYLAVKEALHNIVRHAGATEVHISFRLDKDLEIAIRDNGKGFTRESRFGNGMKNMRIRMESIGGLLQVIHDQGTTIRLNCPLDIHTASI